MMKGEPLLIDMDRVSRGHPIVELSDVYYFYVVLGEDDPSEVEDFLGYSYDTATCFFDRFLRCYLGTDDEERLGEVEYVAVLKRFAGNRTAAEVSKCFSTVVDSGKRRLAETDDASGGLTGPFAFTEARVAKSRLAKDHWKASPCRDRDVATRLFFSPPLTSKTSFGFEI